MGKDDKEDSGFGFKDKAKAEETLKLLEQHEMNYRRLTVRGLLGRAKRVLSLTKAEEKIKNIKEAMEVFENWLADLDKGKEKKDKPAKKEEKKQKMSSSDKDSGSSDEDDKASLPSESVPGLGFKDEAAAEESLKILSGRDPDYQLLAVKGLVRSAKRVLTCTRDETKLSNIKSGIAVLEKFIDDFESQHLSRQNNPYLSAGIVRTAHALAGDDVTAQQRSFLAAYTSVRGEYKRLRNVDAEDSTTWDIVRNNVLKELKEKYANAKLFNEKDEPTKEHIELLAWAYSPEAAKVKKVIKETKEEKKSNDEAMDVDDKEIDDRKKSDGKDDRKKERKDDRKEDRRDDRKEDRRDDRKEDRRDDRKEDRRDDRKVDRRDDRKEDRRDDRKEDRRDDRKEDRREDRRDRKRRSSGNSDEESRSKKKRE